VTTPFIVRKIVDYKKKHQTLFAWEIREKLYYDGICPKDALPSVSSINRILRKAQKRNQKTEEPDTARVSVEVRANCQRSRKKGFSIRELLD
jgi:'Paired box' domain